MSDGIERVRLGLTGVTVPVIGVGTSGYRGGVEPLRRAVDLGADFIDTAEFYQTEDVVGAAIAGMRSRAFVSTKVWPNHFRPDDLRAAAEQSLRLLGTDYIDLYQLHFPRHDIPIAETMGAMEDLVDEGKVRFIGVSNFSVDELRAAQAAMTRHPIVANQIAFSLLERRPLQEILPYCEQHGITVVAHSPLGSPFSRTLARDRHQALTRIARREGRTAAQVALNWCIGAAPLVAIPKTNSLQRVEENAGAAGWRLAAAERIVLERSVRPNRARSRLEVAARRQVRAALNWARARRQAAGVTA